MNRFAYVDALMLVVGALALVIVGIVFAAGRGAALEGGFFAGLVVYAALTACLLWAKRRASGGPAFLVASRVLFYASSATLAVAALARLPGIVSGDATWPPEGKRAE